MALKNYVLGRGAVYLARVHAESKEPGQFRYVGNTTEFNLTAETEDLEHVSSDGGINEVDARVQLSVTRTGTMIMDDIQPDNLAIFFFGAAGDRDPAQPATAAPPDHIEMAAAGEFPERAIFLGTDKNNPAGHRKVTVASVTPVPAAPVLVKDVDYSVDDGSGRILFADTATVRLLTQVTVDYSYIADDEIEIKSGDMAFEGALRFVEDNPEGDDNLWTMPLIALSPNGDLSLKGEEWRQIPLSVSVQKPANAQAIYINGIPA